MLARGLATAPAMATQIEFKQLVGYSVDELFSFNKKFGSTPHNFIPDGPVREHLASPNTIVWGGVKDGKLIGFITAERGERRNHLCAGASHCCRE